jgi:hypothetical protein
MTTIALFGAGGKMGYRLSTNFRGSPYTVRHVEVSDVGRERLKTGLGIDAVSADEALNGAEVVILAVPDTHIGKVAASIESKLASGTMVVVLDAAAPFAGHLPKRPDLTYFVTHPCHPPIFNDETDMAAKKDYFGCRGRRKISPRAKRSPRSSGLLSCGRIASRSTRWRCSNRAFRRLSAPPCSSS